MEENKNKNKNQPEDANSTKLPNKSTPQSIQNITLTIIKIIQTLGIIEEVENIISSLKNQKSNKDSLNSPPPLSQNNEHTK